MVSIATVNDAEITEAFVKAAYRKRGIAGEMISFAEGYCRKNYPLHKFEFVEELI